MRGSAPVGARLGVAVPAGLAAAAAGFAARGAPAGRDS